MTATQTKALEVSRTIALAAFAAKSDAKASRSWGCGRCYVVFSDRMNTKAARVLEGVGFRVFSRPGSSRKQIYVGYDNATGLEYAQAEAIAKAFEVAGVSAYADADGD